MPCPKCFQPPGTAGERARRLVVDDGRPPETEQGGAPTHVAVPNVATILDASATVPGVRHAGLDSASAFFSV